jgi:hypothetical protein
LEICGLGRSPKNRHNFGRKHRGRLEFDWDFVEQADFPTIGSRGDQPDSRVEPFGKSLTTPTVTSIGRSEIDQVGRLTLDLTPQIAERLVNGIQFRA